MHLYRGHPEAKKHCVLWQGRDITEVVVECDDSAGWAEILIVAALGFRSFRWLIGPDGKPVTHRLEGKIEYRPLLDADTFAPEVTPEMEGR